MKLTRRGRIAISTLALGGALLAGTQFPLAHAEDPTPLMQQPVAHNDPLFELRGQTDEMTERPNSFPQPSNPTLLGTGGTKPSEPTKVQLGPAPTPTPAPARVPVSGEGPKGAGETSSEPVQAAPTAPQDVEDVPAAAEPEPSPEVAPAAPAPSEGTVVGTMPATKPSTDKPGDTTLGCTSLLNC